MRNNEIHLQDDMLNISAINREFRNIAISNAWQAYHTPKNLASAIAVESSELLAEFQWLSAEESCQLNASQRAKVAGEIADVVMYLTELCQQLNINMADAVAEKIEVNKQRFLLNVPSA